MLTVVQEGSSGEEPGQPASLIDEIVREGARRMLAEALQAEVDAYIARFAGERDEERPGHVDSTDLHTPATLCQQCQDALDVTPDTRSAQLSARTAACDVCAHAVRSGQS